MFLLKMKHLRNNALKCHQEKILTGYVFQGYRHLNFNQAFVNVLHTTKMTQNGVSYCIIYLCNKDLMWLWKAVKML